LPILARILKDRGMVTERQLQEAIQHQVLYGGRLGTSLYELGFITEERLQEALGRAHGMSGAAPVDHREVQPEAVAALPRALAVRHKVCPYKLRGKTLFLLMVDPQDHEAIAKVSYSLGFIVKPLVVAEFRMIQLLRDHYGVDERWRFTDTHRRGAARGPAPLDADAAVSLFETAEARDEVVDGVMGLLHRVFRRVIFFIVREPWVLGWNGIGEGMDREAAAALRIPHAQPTVFQSVARNRTVFVGRLGEDDVNQRFLKALGKRPQTNAFLFPVVVRGRVVNLLYGDNGASGNVKANLGDLMVQLQKVPRAYLRIIRKRVADTRRAAAEDAAEDTTPQRGNR
jgi:hypothetical protein